MVAQEREQEGQVVVAGIGQMCLALCKDGLRILTNQGPNRCELLFWGLAFLSAADHLTQQQGDKEHPLRIVQMGDGKDGQPRLSGRRIE